MQQRHRPVTHSLTPPWSVIDQYTRCRTQLIIENVEERGGTPATKLRKLLTLTLTAEPHMMLAVRSWARTDALAAKAIKRIDKKRLAYVTGLIEGLGWPQEEAATLARWHYCALIGHFNLQGPALNEAQIELILATLVVPATRRRAQQRI